MFIKSLLIAILASCTAPSLFAQESEPETKPEAPESALSEALDRITFGGYAIVNYYGHSFDTYKAKDEIDLERAIIELRAELSDVLDFELELEIEGGGAGTALELERFEEFGEFEPEIEAGGEVVLEEIELTYQYNPKHRLVFGLQIVQFGAINRAHRPNDYFTNARPEMEVNMIPTAWAATGIGAMGFFNDVLSSSDTVSYSAQIIQGLDSTRFSSATFVAGGQDKPFERAVAEDFAFAGNVSYSSLLGENGNYTLTLAGYLGNSSGNRPKDDFTKDAHVLLLEAHLAVDYSAWTFRAQWLHGSVQNSSSLTTANKNLSNALGAPRTPVASQAMGVSFELGYDLFESLIEVEGQRLQPFLRFESYDTMSDTAASVFDNPRYEREVLTIGLNWRTFGGVTSKLSYSMRELGNTTGGSSEDTFALGVGIVF